MLAAIIQTIIFCGWQELALRGTNDYGRISLEDPNLNDGNFRSLLRYRANYGDELLKNHITSSGSNALYTSPTVQNELIDIIGEDIQYQIIKKIQKAKFFSVLADGTTDISSTEQFSLCIRYIDSDEVKLREDFIKFIPVYDSTGKALANIIKSNIRDIGLDLYLLRGQGYDGASNMKGQFRGVQAFILEEYPKALYTHCASHCLNLCLADASKIQCIRNVLGTISETCTFFRSSTKRSHILKEELKTSSKPGVTSLKKYCETRWVERHEAVALFADAIPQIISALEVVTEQSGCADDAARAYSIHKNICSFNFIIGLTVLERILGLTHSLSEYLQSKCIDLSNAMEKVDLVTEKISKFRTNAEEVFKVLFQKAENTATSFGATVDLPRRVGSQRHRDNYQTNSPEEYYRQSIFAPYLDEILSSLNERFTAHKAEIIALNNVIPHHCIGKSFQDIKPAFEFYIDDMKDKFFSVLEGEWDLWVLKWKTAMDANPDSVPKYAIDALKESSNDSYPNINILLQMLAIFPVSTASVERSFSTLKRLKTYLRNSTEESRLTALALMSVHRDITVNEKAVIDKYGANPRRITFL